MSDDLAGEYAVAGFGTRLGFGRTLAVLTVDLFAAFTDDASPLALPVDQVVKNTAVLLGTARRAGVPVIHSVARFEAVSEAPVMIAKNPVLGTLMPGNDFLEVDPRLDPQATEPVVVKKGASAFFNTSLQPLLTSMGVDTLVVTGISTSGCVRATVVDAIQHGLRPIVPAECVGDRFAEAHQVSLTEMDAKYADVEPMDRVVAHIDQLGGTR